MTRHRTLNQAAFLSLVATAVVSLSSAASAEVKFVSHGGSHPSILVGNDDGEYEWHLQTGRNRWGSYDINLAEDFGKPQQVYSVFADLNDLMLKVNTVDVDNLHGPGHINTHIYRPARSPATVVPDSTPNVTTTLDQVLPNGRIRRLEPVQIERPMFDAPLLAPPTYLMPEDAAYAKSLALTGERGGEPISLVDWDWTPDPPEEIPTRITELPVSVPNGDTVLLGGFVHQPNHGVIGAIATDFSVDVFGLGDISDQAAILSAEIVLIGTILGTSAIDPMTMSLGQAPNGKPFVGFKDGRLLRVVGIAPENGTTMPISRQPLPPETTTAMAFVNPNSNQLSYMAHLGDRNEIIEGRFGRAPRRRIYLEGDVDRFVEPNDAFEDLFIARGSGNVKFDRGYLPPEGIQSSTVAARDRAAISVAADTPGHEYQAVGTDALNVRQIMEGQTLSGIFRAEGDRTAIAAATSYGEEVF